MNMKHVAIIGAGLSGLSCATALQGKFSITLFDKSRGVSGRMSTRYADQFEFDHGAQYFTARHPDFQQAVLKAIDNGHVAPWEGRALYKKNGCYEADRGSARFAAVPRMNSWAKHLAQGYNQKLGCKITSIKRDDLGWALRADNDALYYGFDELVLAIPPVQAAALLPQNFSHMKDVKAARMDACFALMLGFENQLDIDWTSLRIDGSMLAWMALNSSKPQRGKPACLMVHASPLWSNEHAEDAREDVMQAILNEASHITGLKLDQATHKSLHRWLYASVSSGPNIPCLRDAERRITVCGDWCLGGRVENAWLSGRAAAKALCAAP